MLLRLSFAISPGIPPDGIFFRASSDLASTHYSGHFPVLDLCIRFPESNKSKRRATNAFSIRASVTAIGLRPRNVSRALQVPDRLLPGPRPDLPENVLDVGANRCGTHLKPPRDFGC